MKKSRLLASLRPILLSVFFLALGFLALWLVKNVLKIEQDIVLASVAIIPILTYLIFSGRLSEMSLPGGTSLKLSEVLQKPLNRGDFFTEQIEVEPAYVLEKRGMSLLGHMFPDDYARCIVLTMRLGSRGYDNRSILSYLKFFSQFRSFKVLVILDTDGKVFAYTSVWRASQFLEKEVKQNRDDFSEFINQKHTEGLRQRYELIIQTGHIGDTKLDTLKTMTRLRIDTLVVVDDARVLKGVVEREQVLSECILALATSRA
jgi:hypothetical protein